MSSGLPNAADQSDGNSLYAALARTATRSLALYFSRPVRLFRPSKVSGWQTVKGMAAREGVTSLTPTYFRSMVQNHGFMVIPKHFVPPILINAALGTVLWTSYAESYDFFDSHLPTSPVTTAALSGAVAGAAQAAVAAPAENVRLVLKGASGHSWSYAWKEVFHGTTSVPNASRSQQMEEVRQVRSWMRDVGDMAGRGWDGWRWGMAKDIFGFTAFFAIFDITRRTAVKTKRIARDHIFSTELSGPKYTWLPGVVHGGTLVTGGVMAGLSYEFISRPFDTARKVVQQTQHHYSSTKVPVLRSIALKIKEEGLISFFKDGTVSVRDSHALDRRRIQMALRTLARVGPWGVGFLAWEIFGSSGE
ncbi:hypothetical protein BDV98DRAFT_539702 [Pterulicium gracile]|uniref:Mitochondrial carrier domain-containing protein n=1 Tax=Pterulicium gracile TaxID=1884261 RepID=A0A5C3R0B0_9AGAR|nr:hypothetical protein BDV98DRAFT_539702 [Pterula gracilis]